MYVPKKEDVSNVGYYHSYRYQSMNTLNKKMHGIRRVITFCILTTILPTLLLVIPLYLRHVVYADVTYAVTESDIVEIKDGVSSIFCSAHKLKMNETINAFQVSRKPETTSYRKHIRLKKSMTLPDDTLEYWGFYLLKGATVALSVCSRFEGASILVVKGERNLRTCGLLDHNKNKARATGIYLPEADQQVKVTFESNAQEIHSEEITTQDQNPQKDAELKLDNLSQAEQFLKNVANSKKVSENPTKTEVLENITEGNKHSKKVTEVTQFLESVIETTKSFESLTEFLENEAKIQQLSAEKTKQNDLRQNNIKNFVQKKRHGKKLQKPNNRRETNLVYKNKILGQNVHENKKERVNLLKVELLEDKPDAAKEENDENRKLNLNPRQKRHQDPVQPPRLWDQGIKHGGNAAKKVGEDSSISSFENSLFTCYGGQVLLAQEFNESEHCMDVNYLINGKHMQSIHDVVEPGYYYYIFYSDNDKVSNDIHAVFDIYKPTLQYENVTLACINKTECTFPLRMFTTDRVIIEVPTKDGIDHEIDDISLLVSTCVPRMGVYIVFPITVLFLILGCAFL